MLLLGIEGGLIRQGTYNKQPQMRSSILPVFPHVGDLQEHVPIVTKKFVFLKAFAR